MQSLDGKYNLASGKMEGVEVIQIDFPELGMYLFLLTSNGTTAGKRFVKI